SGEPGCRSASSGDNLLQVIRRGGDVLPPDAQEARPMFQPVTKPFAGERSALQSLSGAAPRWTWRLFTTDRAQVARILRFITGPAEGSHADRYLLSTMSPHEVKVRHDRLDVRRISRVHHGGLELWESSLSTTFPLDATALEETC